ncbi:hypothetical protein L596_020656 [Steinernema carpocapsae]|uniref:7TM GPCR serpentine receptor class x (Srx) domain-containing protein n=1 Tax=Steinernema carpocapsae TaxID=34508 RepID=A0A4U5MU69_STECR|nr:hypothetical protein L596_020656 [Steinernema carpocapsae]
MRFTQDLSLYCKINCGQFFATGKIFRQFKNIPLVLGLGAFSVNYWFGCAACVMHQFIALNRFIAVCLPLMYDKIFKRTNYRLVIVACWTECLIVVIAYYGRSWNLI